jgi:acetyl-CoA/propionyl-CoA carboxylase biotin carboxyl carrier protein
MISKLIVHGVDREHARRRMLRALGEYVIEGPSTLIPFHTALLEHDCFIGGGTCAGIVESLDLDGKHASNKLLIAQGRTVARVRTVEVDGRRFEVRITEPEAPWLDLARRRRERVRAGAYGSGGRDAVVSPMQGTVLSVAVADGDEVEAGALICIVEAMKMENEVHAHRAGSVTELSVAPGEPVAHGQVICVLESHEAFSNPASIHT